MSDFTQGTVTMTLSDKEWSKVCAALKIVADKRNSSEYEELSKKIMENVLLEMAKVNK